MLKQRSLLIGRLEDLFGAFFPITEEDRDWTALALQVVPTSRQLRVAPKTCSRQVQLVGFCVGDDFCQTVGLPFDLVFAIAAVNAQRMGVDVIQAHAFVARALGAFVHEMIRNGKRTDVSQDLVEEYKQYHTYEEPKQRLVAITARLEALLKECSGMKYIAHHVWTSKLFAGCEESFEHMILEAPKSYR